MLFRSDRRKKGARRIFGLYPGITLKGLFETGIAGVRYIDAHSTVFFEYMVTGLCLPGYPGLVGVHIVRDHFAVNRPGDYKFSDYKIFAD